MKKAAKVITVILLTSLWLLPIKKEIVNAADSFFYDSSTVAITVLGSEEITAENQDGVVINGQSGYSRGNNPPTQPYNLSGNPYYYYIIGMHDHVFTDCYFKPDSNGCISISVNGLNSGGDSIRIKLCRRTFFDYTSVGSWTGNPQSIQGLGFSGLSTTEDYFFLFETLSSSTEVNGSGYIHFPGDIIP
jgi:hypothetical protein